MHKYLLWGVMMKRYRSITASERTGVSGDDVRELVLYITNDGELYRGMTSSIISNMRRKRKSGKYDSALAVKGWMYLADAGVRKYDKEFGSGKGSLTMLNKATREAIAEELMEYYEDEISYVPTEASTKLRSKRNVTAASVTSSIGLSAFEPWSGAVDTWEKLEDFDKLDELEQYIDSEYYNDEAGEGVIDETALNDLLWFEPEFVYEMVGLYYDSQTGEVSDEPFDEDEDDEQ